MRTLARTIISLAIFLCLSFSVQAQSIFFGQNTHSDPLASRFKPSIDTNASDYPSNIWITDTMQKIRQDSGLPGNVKWATVYATQNEFQGFQIHFHDTGNGTSNYSVQISDLVQIAPHRFTISANSSNIIVYREAYINVTQITAISSTYYNAPGVYPDPLIPAVDPYYGQVTNAFPFTIAPGNNQSVWIDIHIPANAPSGYYKGNVTVKSGTIVLATLPVVYAVWQWPHGSMPSTSSLSSYTGIGFAALCVQAYGGYNNCGAYPKANGSADRGVTLSTIDFAVLMLDHRFSAANPVYPPYTNMFAGLETDWGPLLNGTPANTQTILQGARLTSIAYAPNGFTNVQDWQTEFQNKGWLAKLFDYSCDEPPNGCVWSTVNSNALALHASTPPMDALVTADISDATTNNSLNSIDTLVPIINNMDPQGGSLQRSSYNSWLLSNCCGVGLPVRKLWSYQSCSSSGTCGDGAIGGVTATWPNLDVDGLPVANRVMEWLTFYHNQSGELYYGASECWITTCGYPTTSTDPWISVYKFGGNGDGTLVYPGRQIGGAESIGTTNPIWIPSIRLKMIRDGMQDYEYLQELTSLGFNTTVMNQIQSWITNSYTFNTNPSALQNAREVLGNLLHHQTY